MVVRQGDVVRIDAGKPRGSSPAYRRPFVVIQNDVFNRSHIATVVVCALTSNLGRAAAPGSVLLRQGEANLPKRSVVNPSQILTADKSAMVHKIGTLSRERVREILDGVDLVLKPREVKD